jgi:TonB-dependent SusC/RagA subfamily outer membrane receptor
VIIADSINLAPVTSFSEFLQGRTATVRVDRSSGASGTGSRIRIRGANSLILSNDPLVIVDGVRINAPTASLTTTESQPTSRLDDLQPEDIEHVEVLAGPAATWRYGTGAANGVLLVTTKARGRERVHWNVHATLGSLTEPVTFPTSYDQIGTTSSGTHLRRCDLLAQAAGQCTPIGDSLLQSNPLEQHSPFSTGLRREAGLSGGSGGRFGSFYVAANLAKERGVFDINSLRRTTLYATGTLRLHPTLSTTFYTSYLDGTLRLPISEVSLRDVLVNGLIMDPTDSSAQNGFFYPIDVIRSFSVGQNIDHFLVGGAATWTPASWFKTVARVGADQLHGSAIGYDAHTSNPTNGSTRDGTTAAERIHQFTTQITATASWQVTPMLRFTPMLGIEHLRRNARDTASGFESTSPIGPAFGVILTRSENAITGIIGQIELAWKDRVYLTAGVRRDHVLWRFPDTSSTATYPAANIAWTVSNESWFPKSVVRTLTLRSAYGEAGQSVRAPTRIGADLGIPLPFAGSLPIESTVPHLERSREAEIGFDAGDVWRSHVARAYLLSADEYQRRSPDPALLTLRHVLGYQRGRTYPE